MHARTNYGYFSSNRPVLQSLADHYALNGYNTGYVMDNPNPPDVVNKYDLHKNKIVVEHPEDPSKSKVVAVHSCN